MRIHLLCDHKWRDLPNLAVLKNELGTLGHRVLISTTKDAHAMLQVFRPDCVVLNHLFAPSNQQLAASLRANGVAVVILPTEGAARPELRPLIEGEFARDFVLDLHLAWSEPAARDLRARWGLDEAAVPAIGCTRLDFYDVRFQPAITPREVFCRHNNLDPKRPIVTWATAYNFADVERTTASSEKFFRQIQENGLAECYRRIGIDPRDLPRRHAQARIDAVKAFITLAKVRPDVQFVVRPHPSERRDFYREIIEDNDLRSTRFCPQDYIWNVLNASDVHLHRHCTTAVEAWMWNKPTIEMAMTREAETAWPEREKASEIAESSEELIGIVDRCIASAPADAAHTAYRNAYIRKWFGPADGRRCHSAALAIDGLLAARRTRRARLRPLQGLSATPRQIGTAVLRHALSRRPNESLLHRRQAVDPQDKQITRRDVRDYCRLVSAASLSPSQDAASGNQ